jgi:hypothetical protein
MRCASVEAETAEFWVRISCGATVAVNLRVDFGFVIITFGAERN